MKAGESASAQRSEPVIVGTDSARSRGRKSLLPALRTTPGGRAKACAWSPVCVPIDSAMSRTRFSIEPPCLLLPCRTLTVKPGGVTRPNFTCVVCVGLGSSTGTLRGSKSLTEVMKGERRASCGQLATCVDVGSSRPDARPPPLALHVEHEGRDDRVRLASALRREGFVRGPALPAIVMLECDVHNE